MDVVGVCEQSVNWISKIGGSKSIKIKIGELITVPNKICYDRWENKAFRKFFWYKI